MEYSFLLAELEKILGKGSKRARDNYAFHCPFCNHTKPKLEIKIITNESGENHWECWRCEKKGKTIKSLLYQLKIGKEQAEQVLKYIKKTKEYTYKTEAALELPKEFQLLHEASETSLTAITAKRFLHDRGLTDTDFIKYNIGYCTTGEYADRIIIPSYDESNSLNFFVTRTFKRGATGNHYKNPETSKDIVFFENLINWNQPIIIIEGPLDAIAARRNAIPVLGKNISKSLMLKIITSKVEDIYIALDKDALKKAIIYCEKFISMGKRVYLVNMEDKDPSKMGFVEFTKHIQTIEELTLSKLVRYKLEAL